MTETVQHGALKSILLHLLPGVAITAFIFIFSNPFFTELFGIDQRLGPLVGFLLAILIVLIPVQLGILLLAGKSETGRYTIRGIIPYLERSKTSHYLIYVPVLIVYSILLFVVVAPAIQDHIIRIFFSWWPEEYNFQLVLQDPSTLAGYKGVKILLFIYILLGCLAGPLVEELYFRGYLLPRMERYAGSWSAFLNTTLFSLYHFFSPWEFLIRIAAIYPLVHIVKKRRNIFFSIIVHLTLNTIGGIIMLVIILRAS